MMNEEDKALLEKLKTQRDKRNQRQQNFVKNTYDRLAIFVPKGDKAKIEDFAKSHGYRSINAYVTALIQRDMCDDGNYCPF